MPAFVANAIEMAHSNDPTESRRRFVQSYLISNLISLYLGQGQGEAGI